MPRPALRKVDRAEEGGPRLAHLDRDRRLVEAAQADPARFEALYRKYLAQVYSYAFYELRDHHDAEDVTERTFLAALTNLGRFEERARPADGEGASTFRVWLFRIARNAVAERARRRRRRAEAPLEAAATVAAPHDVEAEAAFHDDAAAAWRAVGRLRGDRRRAVILRFVDEMSTAEIAGILDRSEGAVRVLIHRALRSVAHDLGSAGRDLGSAGRALDDHTR
jgi:RNA polymerase sigma-70 factor (ECF subfamily)